jgi:Integrase zinc binding domain/Integrase core domain
MNRTLYYDLVIWLARHEVREDVEEWTKNILITAGRNFELQNNILYRKKAGEAVPVIQQGKTEDIIKLAHNHPLAGHMGQRNTYFRLQGNVWWPGMQDDIIKYIRSCDTCQKRARNKEIPEASSATIRTEPFAHIGIDVMGPLPVSLTGKRYIILVVDFFTKYTEAVATEEADAQTVVKFLYTDVICRHGVPKEITSDRGTEFLNDLVREFERTYHIKHIRTTAYHPQGNGQTERTNQTVKNILAKICKDHDYWDHYLDSALFAVRTIKQKSTEFSPFELVYGRKPNREFHHTKPDIGSYDDRLWAYVARDITRLQLIRRKAAEFIRKAQERQRETQNKKANAIKLHIGDKVLLFRSITESSWSAKLEPKWEGPYYVQDIKEQSIWLRKLTGAILPTPVHRSKLKKYYYDKHKDL